ncbi:ScyD/ScyE family protein [Nocardioides sp. JQ2195]|uniref:ScyD/ScyE family protein n=1 Tax=Nocardioides sp. JQ2195 TaxID=2592334 RepID=UPI00143E541B|nr:ScyD/ScyE family protein [Nocardioides sp. JQ2195]QIX27910.1 ScyD/ScyE family protein [Nocardioides sp. JQ2195]
MVQHPARLAMVGLGAAALVISGALPAQAGGGHGHHHGHKHHEKITTVAELSGPRGVDSIAPGKTLVTQDNGDLSLVVERGRHRDARVIRLSGLPESAGFSNAVSSSHGRTYVLTGAGEGAGSATLYRLMGDDLTPVADIGAYQVTDPDPNDLEDFPEDSNPYGVVALRDGTVLVADAAANELLRVWPDGTIRTVARVKPRTVAVPDGLPATDPEGNPLPPAGTQIPSEAVTTSVTVGSDGYWYVGELRGFPATPGTSQIWRIRPGTLDATCDPEAPDQGDCTRYADGLTSIVDLSADRHGHIYATSLSKMSWLAMELEVPGSEVGAIIELSHGGQQSREIAEDKVILPGGTDVASNGDLYLTGPIFGPGALMKIR